jgi:hypothetical protein
MKKQLQNLRRQDAYNVTHSSHKSLCSVDHMTNANTRTARVVQLTKAGPEGNEKLMDDASMPRPPAPTSIMMLPVWVVVHMPHLPKFHVQPRWGQSVFCLHAMSGLRRTVSAACLVLCLRIYQ